MGLPPSVADSKRNEVAGLARRRVLQTTSLAAAATVAGRPPTTVLFEAEASCLKVHLRLPCEARAAAGWRRGSLRGAGHHRASGPCPEEGTAAGAAVAGRACKLAGSEHRIADTLHLIEGFHRRRLD